MLKTKTTVTIKSSEYYRESYNSELRAVVSNLVDQKYARKLVQDKLKSCNIFGCTVNTLYKQHNGIDSNQGDHWVFGISIPIYYTFVDIYQNL